jgi:hypothetical protein
MSRYYAGGLCAFALSMLSGCGARTIPISYGAAGITPLPDLEPLAVYMLVDRRGEEPTRIGGIYGGFKNTLNRLYSDQPAAKWFHGRLQMG